MGRRKGFPRGYNGPARDPTWVLFNKDKPAITIHEHAAVIHETVEEAAVAVSNSILNYKNKNPGVNYGKWGPIEFYIDKDITLVLSDQQAMNRNDWEKLKKDVEKICNDLTAFM